MSSTSNSKRGSHGKSDDSFSANHRKAESSRLAPVITPSRPASRAPSPAVSQRKKTNDVGHQTEIPAVGGPQIRLTEEQIKRLATQVEEKKVLAKVVKQCIKLAEDRGWSVIVSKANLESGVRADVSMKELLDKLQAIDTFSLDTDEVKSIKTDFLRYFKEQCDSERARLKKVEGHDDDVWDDPFGFNSTSGLRIEGNNLDFSLKEVNKLHVALSKVLRMNAVK